VETADEDLAGTPGSDVGPDQSVLVVAAEGPDEPAPAEAPPVDDVPGPPVAPVAPDISSEMLAALLPYLQEAVMVVRENWRVVANLAPPQGLSDRPRRVGTHVMSHLHPDDALRLFERGSEGFLAAPGWTTRTTARVQQRDGSFEPYDITIHNRRDDPVIDGMVICSRRSATSEEASSTASTAIRVEMFAELLPIGVAVLSPKGQPLFANPVAAELLGTELEPLCKGRLMDVLAEVDRCRVAETIAELAGKPGRRRLLLDPNQEGRRLELDLGSGQPTGTGGPQLVIATISDVTQGYAREQQLEHRANHDGLTGLANRTWLLDHLHDRIERGDELVVAFLDLDRFKSVNDRLGHVAGDAVLAAVGAGLRDCLHDGEVAVRVGGDEFVIVSSGLTDDGVADLDQRIRLAVATVPAARRQQVGASVGVVRSVADDEPKALLRRADAAMYGEKRRTDRRDPNASVLAAAPD